MDMASVDGDPCQVIRHGGGFDLCGELLESGQVVEVQRICRTERHADAMQRDRVKFANAFQVIDRQPAGAEVILGQNLEPGDGGFAIDYFPIVPGSQAYAGAGDRGCGESGHLCSVIPGSYIEFIDLWRKGKVH